MAAFRVSLLSVLHAVLTRREVQLIEDDKENGLNVAEVLYALDWSNCALYAIECVPVILKQSFKGVSLTLRTLCLQLTEFVS